MLRRLYRLVVIRAVGTPHHHDVGGDTDPDSHTHTGTTNNNAGIDAVHQNMPPAIVCNKIIVAE